MQASCHFWHVDNEGLLKGAGPTMHDHMNKTIIFDRPQKRQINLLQQKEKNKKYIKESTCQIGFVLNNNVQLYIEFEQKKEMQ